MRAKRAAILFSLLTSLVALGWTGLLLLGGGSSPETVYADQQTSSGVGGPGLSSDPETTNDVETRSVSLTGYFVSAGALVSGGVFLVSTVLFRKEVSAEKAAGRARKQRLDYHKDLRRYHEQMQGPPKDNT